MLLTKEVEVVLTSNTINYYENLSYEIPKVYSQGKYRVKKGTILKVKVEDLPDKSNVKVNVKCDCEDCKNPYLKPMSLQNYLRSIKNDGKYYCKKCVNKLIGGKNRKLNKLKNGKSFEYWCITHNYQDILDRWDYELNDCKPNEITYGINKKYYFKCPRKLHKSELKNIALFTKNKKDSMNCSQCNSFAQWGIDNLGEDFLEKYWDYNKNTINPWEIPSQYNKKVFIKCQEKYYHESYEIYCSHFMNGNRCSYCANRKIHPLDSLGTLYPQVLEIWSDKNKKSPYEYGVNSREEVYWKCLDGKHEDYPRSVYNSKRCDFRCPECQYSKGEESIGNYLKNKCFIKIDQYDFIRLIDKDKHNKNYYIPQKEFDGLLGLGNGLLSYDFYLPNLNLLIEFQGEQHERYIKGFHKSYEDFLKQQEHDKRKKEYAIINKYNFLEIWYYDFDRIEEILDRDII